MFVAINENHIIIAVSSTPIQLEGATTMQFDFTGDKNSLIGKKIENRLLFFMAFKLIVFIY